MPPSHAWRPPGARVSLAATVLVLALAGLLAGGSALAASPGPAAPGPAPPCAGPGSASQPAFGPPDGQPRVTVWRNIELAPPPSCPPEIAGRYDIVVALAGRFRSPETLTGIARRIGAITALRGLAYWSVTEGRWRPLIADAFAVTRFPDPVARPDFEAAEVLGGDRLLFSQDDSRSSGYNVYAMRTIRASERELVLESYNLTPIRLLFVPLIEARGARSLLFIGEPRPGEWTYYGLSLLRGLGTEGNERSLINRAAAYYRHLAGQPADGAPPLAP